MIDYHGPRKIYTASPGGRGNREIKRTGEPKTMKKRRQKKNTRR